jgi:hypothetical protein
MNVALRKAIDVFSPGVNYVHNTHMQSSIQQIWMTMLDPLSFRWVPQQGRLEGLWTYVSAKTTTTGTTGIDVAMPGYLLNYRRGNVQDGNAPLIWMQLVTLRRMIFTRVCSLVRPYRSFSSLTWTNHLS